MVLNTEKLVLYAGFRDFLGTKILKIIWFVSKQTNIYIQRLKIIPIKSDANIYILVYFQFDLYPNEEYTMGNMWRILISDLKGNKSARDKRKRTSNYIISNSIPICFPYSKKYKRDSTLEEH